MWFQKFNFIIYPKYVSSFFQPFDFLELYKALKKVLCDEKFAKDLGDRAREFVVQNYNAEDVARKIENVYNSLL